MRGLRSPGLIAAIAVACVALPAAAVGAQTPLGTASPAAAAANSVTYTDSTGEDPLAPDISTIVVSNNDAGVVSMRINVPNRPAFGQDMIIFVFVDTDNNTATGDPESLGADYVIQVFQGEAALFRWDGTDFTRRPGDPAATSLIFQYANGITISISANELGATTRFGFAAIVVSGITIDPVTGDLDFTNAKSDVAPSAGSGFYNYQVLIGRPTLIVRSFTKTPARPLTGKAFSLKLQAARSDTGAVLQGGRVTCVGRVGGAALRAQTARVVSGRAVCTWRIPPGAKGKLFRGSVTIVFEGLKASRSFSGRVG